MTDVGIDEFDIAEQIIRNKLEIERLTAMNGELTQWFRQDDTGTRSLVREGRPQIIVRVTSNSRIDDGLARKNLTATEYKAVSKQTIDTAKARALLSANRINEITKQYDNKVEVTLA